MTRNDSSLVLLIVTFALLSSAQSPVSLIAFVAAVCAHSVLVLMPIIYDSRADVLRKDLNEALAKHASELEALKNKVDVLTLGRAR